jgi:hypothetical protein
LPGRRKVRHIRIGRELRACRDAETAIAAAARVKRWVSVIDLSTIRRASAATESSR